MQLGSGACRSEAAPVHRNWEMGALSSLDIYMSKDICIYSLSRERSQSHKTDKWLFNFSKYLHIFKKTMKELTSFLK